MTPINKFTGEYRFLSNFHPAVVHLDGHRYPTVEHAFQAAKTLDATHRASIGAAQTPGAAKRLGRLGTLRPGWDLMRVAVMRDLLQQKFAAPDLRRALLATGDAALEEGNWWGDAFWGVCNGRGENVLGRLLMEIRTSMRPTTDEGEAEGRHD